MDKQFLADVVGIVEATNYEYHCLWKEYCEKGSYTWVENLSGYGPTIGYVDSRPIVVSLSTAVVDGHKILFVDPCSLLVDWKMIDEWLIKNLPASAMQDGGQWLNKVDAMNFGSVFTRG